MTFMMDLCKEHSWLVIECLLRKSAKTVAYSREMKGHRCHPILKAPNSRMALRHKGKEQTPYSLSYVVHDCHVVQEELHYQVLEDR